MRFPLRPATNPAAFLRAACLLAPLGLAACGGGGSAARFPPPCPHPAILPESGDLHLFRGAGRDITDQMLSARIEGIDGACSPGGRAATNVQLIIDFSADRGPAAPSRVADIPWFIGVAQGDRILDRQAYVLHAVFPPNADHVTLQSNPIHLKLPTSDKVSAAAYTVWVAFQLTPDEISINRTTPSR